jgi:hypothetical protein
MGLGCRLANSIMLVGKDWTVFVNTMESSEVVRAAVHM